MKHFRIFLTFFIFTFFNFNYSSSQEKQPSLNLDKKVHQARVGVVDMKRILNQSKVYQSLVDQFEEIRRKQRNIVTKQEDQIRDEESNLIKQKNVLSKEVYAEKVKALNLKINELKTKQMGEGKKYEALFEKSTNKIQGALVDVLSVIANKADLNLVLAKSQVILVGKDIDITAKAVVELNKVLPKVTLGEK